MTTSLGSELSRLVTNMRSNHLTMREAVTALRKEWITATLSETHGNNCRAARSMGIHRNSLSRMSQVLGIDVNSIRQAR